MTEKTMLAIVIVSTIAMIYVVTKMYRSWKRDMSADEVTVRATVADKRSTSFHQHYDAHRPQSGRFYITFLTEDGDMIELQVSQSDYMTILADAKGMLTYQGSLFGGFERIEATEEV